MRLIDADSLKKRKFQGKSEYTTGWNDALDAVTRFEPTIDAEPVRHGKWRIVNCATGLRCQCSECLHWVDIGTDRNYCPNCGARMDEDDKS